MTTDQKLGLTSRKGSFIIEHLLTGVTFLSAGKFQLGLPPLHVKIMY